MHTIYHNISFSDIESQIDTFRALDLKSTELPVIRGLAKRLFTGFTWCDELYTRYPIQNIYRARINKDNVLFSNVSELINPQPKKVTKLGRLNDIGVSVFYGACEYETAILENRPEEGQFVTVLRCVPLSPQEFQYMELGIVENILRNVNYTNTLDKHSAFKNTMVTHFLTDEVVKIVNTGEKFNYKTTIAFGELFLESRGGALLYPSVIRLKRGINIAIRPDIFNSSIRIVECRVFKVIKKYCRLLYDCVNLEPCLSINENGDIAWSKQLHDIVENGAEISIESDKRPMPNGI
jgi:hypothetical protein